MTIKINRLGKTDLHISKLGLGTVALGMAYGITPESDAKAGRAGGMTPPTLAEATRLIHQAIDGGITFIDTARAYGRSEEVLGHALQGWRERVVLASKMSIHDSNGQELKGEQLREHMETSLSTSLRLLKTDHIDLMMLHSTPADYAESVGILQEFQQRGDIRAIGASTYGTADPLRAIEAGVDALQVAYNILDQRMDDAVFPKAAEAGVGIVVRSVFLKGALTPRSVDLPDHLSELKEKSDAVKAIGAKQSPPLNQIEIALRFALSNPKISTTLIGARTEKEVAIALTYAALGNLSDDVMANLHQLSWDNSYMLNPGNWDLP